MVIKVGIIGFGKMGRLRYQILNESNDFQVIGICDENCQDQIIKHTDYKSFIEESGLDAVFIATPPGKASAITIEALKAGLHVFCEKPPATKAEDLLQVREIEKKHPNLVLAYGFNHRQHGSIERLLELNRSEAYGQLLNIRGVYGKAQHDKDWRMDYEASGGGILMDQGIHLLDIILLLMGEIKQIKSMANFKTSNIEDDVMTLLKNEHIHAILHSSSRQSPELFRLEAVYEQATIVAQGILSSSGKYAPESLAIYKENSSNPISEEFYEEDLSWTKEINLFCNAITKNEKVDIPDSKQAYQLLSIIEKIYHEIREGS